MQLAVVSSRSHFLDLRRGVCCGVLCLCALPHFARAASPVPAVDTAGIASLQIRVQQAGQREQVQMYADLVDRISVLASRQIADGELEDAAATLHQLESCIGHLESNLQRDSKGLKKTEVMLHTTHRRLQDLVRSASGDMKPAVENVVQRLDRVQTTLLSAVFEH